MSFRLVSEGWGIELENALRRDRTSRVSCTFRRASRGFVREGTAHAASSEMTMTGSSSSGQPTPASPTGPAVPGAVTTHAYLFHLVGIAESVLPVADSVCTPVGCRELRDSLFFHVVRHSAYREWRHGGAWHARFRAIAPLAASPFSLPQARVSATVRNVIDWVDDPSNSDRVTFFAWSSGSHARWVRYFTRLELVRAADPVLSAKGFALREKVAELGIPRSTLSRLLKVLKRKSSARSRWTREQRCRLIRRMKTRGDRSEFAVCGDLAPSFRRSPVAVHRYWLRLKKKRREEGRPL